jgi:hypothetical protein
MINIPPYKGTRELEERTGKNAEDFLTIDDAWDEEDPEEEE